MCLELVKSYKLTRKYQADIKYKHYKITKEKNRIFIFIWILTK